MNLATTFVTTRTGASIAVHEAGDGPHRLVVIGGLAGRALTETPVRPVLEAAGAQGVRVTAIDAAGSGQSKKGGEVTMQTWLDEIEEIFAARVGERAIWAGASVGAWLMLILHQRHPEWFHSMCALAPAIDFDQYYVGPGLRDGKLGVAGDDVTNADGTALAPRSLLVS